MEQNTQKLLGSVNTAIIKIRGAYAAWAREHRVNYHETLIFYSLRDHDTCTQKQICDSYLLPKQTVNNIITSLKKSGYLCLVPDEQGGHGKLLKLTESGKKYAESIMDPLLLVEEEAVKLMGEENLRAMTEMALRYGSILEESMARVEKEKGVFRDEKDNS